MAEEMLKIAGKESVSGTAKPFKVDTLGNLGTTIEYSKIALPTDLQHHDLSDADALPIKPINGLLIDFENTTQTIFGVTQSNDHSTIEPVSAAGYKDFTIVVRNNFDKRVLVHVSFTKSTKPGAFGKNNILYPIENVSIAAGATFRGTKIEYPKLETPTMGMAIQLKHPDGAPATGTADVIVIGGN